MSSSSKEKSEAGNHLLGNNRALVTHNMDSGTPTQCGPGGIKQRKSKGRIGSNSINEPSIPFQNPEPTNFASVPKCNNVKRSEENNSVSSMEKLLECTEDKVNHFELMAKRARKKLVREYYSCLADLLRNVREDTMLVNRFDAKSAKGAQNAIMDSAPNAAERSATPNRLSTRMMVIASLCVNIVLPLVKCTASLLSGSFAIISSLVDSMLDLVSGVVTWYTTREIRERDPYLYPRGCTRMEPLGSIIVSVIMGIANVQIISKSIEAALGNSINIDVRLPTVSMMAFTILCKFVLYILCRLINNPSISVLTLDHRNDCISNTVAITCAYLAYYYHSLRFLDPLGAILVSSYISFTWFVNGRQHMSILSGQAAKPEFYSRILHVALDHLPDHVQQIETLKVYHLGTQFLVELHIVLDRDMPVHQAHDISELLQRKIEHLPYVERAFVHVDHDITHSPEEEHKDV